MQNYLGGALALVALSGLAYAQEQVASVTMGSLTITVKYSSPTTKGRATASFHTPADLAFQGLNLPKGDYTLYILAGGSQWRLAISKATGAAAAAKYDPMLDIGRVPMTMTKPVTPAAGFAVTVTKISANAAKLDVMWNGAEAAAPFHLSRGAGE